jgi:CHAD domain-containing protein
MAANLKLKWNRREDPAANASRELPRIIDDFFAGTRQAIAEPGWPRNLHGVRLASKKLRYTLELFRPIYPAALEVRLDELKKLQDWLGDAHDASASRELLGRATLSQYPAMREFLEKRAAAKTAAFTRYWEKTFDAEGQQAWWTNFLAHKARAPR